jgi:hypothetical protein
MTVFRAWHTFVTLFLCLDALPNLCYNRIACEMCTILTAFSHLGHVPGWFESYLASGLSTRLCLGDV